MKKHLTNLLFIWAIGLLLFLAYAIYKFYQTNSNMEYLLTPQGMSCYKLYV